ncbi:MAG: (Fe-S)-binding protein [Elusimicrobia bacterium]|nr:(Fe-S)-binding protein [Elusimicrobiota bacterium]
MFSFSASRLRRQLRALFTPFGERSVYDSAAHCTRCGSCQQSCPSYALNKQETFSPRGRNQALRLIMERKLDPRTHKQLLEEIVNSCTLCGRCTQTCAGKIPTAEHMLELRRALNLRALPGSLYTLLSLRGTRPALFDRLVRTGLFLRRLGLVALLRKTGLTRLFGLEWINRADDLLPRRIPSLQKYLAAKNIQSRPENPDLIYLPSLEAQYFLPELAASILKSSAEKHRPVLWPNVSSGLFEYVYGDLRRSRRAVRRLIRRAEQANLPILTDSVDVFTFLHRAPQLFAGNKRWEHKARKLAENMRFVTDFLPKKPLAFSDVKTPVRLDYSALFCREGEPLNSVQKILKTLFKKNFVECLYTDADTPAFGYGFVRNSWAEPMALNAVRTIAQTQTATVFTLSGLSALELNYSLKRLYPNARAEHVARLNG